MAYNYYPNNQFYMQDLQNMKDRIDRQMQQIQQQNQMQQTQPQVPQINQSFQLAPSPTNNELESKYVDNIEQVKNTFVMKTGIFLTKDFKTLWVKDVTGNIKTYKTEEIIELDEKDREILDLQKQVNELKGMIKDATKYDNTNITQSIENQEPKRVSDSKRSNAK